MLTRLEHYAYARALSSYRLDTGFKERTGTLPNPDSDAGRALFSLEIFASELHKLNFAKVLNHKG